MERDRSFLRYDEINFSRRRFVKGVAAGGFLLGLGGSPGFLSAAPAAPQVLQGRSFQLKIGEQRVNYTGRERMATAVNGSVPGPVLRWKEGDRITLDVSNALAESSSIHWHGIILPTGMDGVPDISYSGIAPGQTFRYQFDLHQSGTYWYHSHSGFQ